MIIIKDLIYRIKNSALFKDATWSIIGNVIGKGFSLFAGIVVARLLGKEVYGEYGIIKTTLLMIAMFSTFGLGITATKFIAEVKDEFQDKIRTIYNICIKISFIISIIIAVGVVTFASPISEVLDAPHLRQALQLSAVAIVFNSINTTQIGILGGFKAYKEIARNNVIIGVITFVLTVPLTLLMDFNGAVVAMVLTLILNCFINYISIKKYLPSRRLQLTKNLTRDVLMFSLPVALQESLYSVTSWGASFVIIKMSGYGELGLTNAATQWMAVMSFVPGALRNVALSYLSTAKDNKTQSEKLLRSLLLINFSSVMIPCIIVWIFSSLICSLYGSQYVGLQCVLNVMAFTAVVMSMTNIMTQELIAMNKNWYLFITRLIRDSGILLMTWYVLSIYSKGALGYACVLLFFHILYLLMISIKYKTESKTLFEKI